MTAGGKKMQRITELAILTAIVVLLQLVGYNIRIGDFSISLILLPVVVGAVLCGPWGGAWLGVVFGTVLILTGETDTFVEISLPYTIICTAIRGALAGFAAGLVYESLKEKKEELAIVLASVTAPMVNTSLFIILVLIFFYDVFEGIMGPGNLIKGMIKSYVSINFLIELSLNMVFAPILVRLAKRIKNDTPVKEPLPVNKQKKKLATRLTVTLILLGVIVCAVSAIRSSIADSIVTIICIEVIFITLYYYYISYRVIAPIKTISGEVSNFVENRNRTGTSIEEIATDDEIQQLAEDIVKMKKDIENYISDITAITAEKERIGTELNVATKIQADMLPSVFPAFPDRTDFDIFASMTPAKEVGGDFYDFFLLDDDHIALVIADVSDKGVPAALFMVIAKTLIKNQASFTRSPREILEAVNTQLCQSNTSRMFVTVWMGILELSTGNCVAANAGHEYPAIRKADGEFELIKDDHGFVLAGLKNSKYSEYEFNVEKGGAIFVYTDGVTEAADSNEEMFGTERMLSALNISAKASPAETIETMKGEIKKFVGNAPQYDDITMLCIKRI